MHTNLFSQGHSRREVKEALNDHQKRDNGMLKLFDAVFGLCILFLVRNQPTWDAVAIVVAVYAGVSGMRYFVDQSARNYYLHRLDWEETGPDPDDVCG